MVRIAFFLIAAPLVLSACSSGDDPLACRLDNADSAALDTVFITREFNATYLPAEALQVTYLATNSDSRCPTGVQCVRAGEATIAVELAIDEAEAEQFALSTSDELAGNQTSVTYMGYQVELRDVMPYPEGDRDIAEGERCAEFFVSVANP